MASERQWIRRPLLQDVTVSPHGVHGPCRSASTLARTTASTLRLSL